MIEIRRTEYFAQWLSGLRDHRARGRIEARIDRLRQGNPGDVKPVGKGISELRVDYGPGYRVYFVQQDNTVIVLLAGGDKRTQSQDIQFAQDLAQQL